MPHMTTMVDEAEGTPEALVAGRAAGQPGDWLIRASGVRKKYCRDLRRSLWYSIRDVVEALHLRKEQAEVLREHEFWAVDNISFELRRGDSLGLLGRNGAGKSTLLKLITGQRSLTAGKVETRGRIVALTELGLGFDPVLSGRENAYVNAAVYGVSRRNFDKVIEQIIDFSELREFIDSAVHTYSTGMKARLGFSVATHLNPDILVVDEVLAVGDLEFRRKCVQHVHGYLANGGSVVLVAHDPYLVQSICNRSIVLDRGKILFEGSGVEGVDVHFRLGHRNQYESAKEGTERSADDPGDESSQSRSEIHTDPPKALEKPAAIPEERLELTAARPMVLDSIEVVPVEGDTLYTGKPAKVIFRYRTRISATIGWGFTICTGDLRINIASCAQGMDGNGGPTVPGEHALVCLLPELTLQAGVYAVRGGIGDAVTQAALAVRGYEDKPHFFTVATSQATRSANFSVMQDDLVTMKVEWLSLNSPSGTIGG
jgi:ABC-type polysaccharide/polyol phosphate transport system ATPase subunit